MLKEGISQAEIAEQVRTSQVSVHKACFIFENIHKLIRMSPDVADNRRMVCFLTKEGKELREKIENIFK